MLEPICENGKQPPSAANSGGRGGGGGPNSVTIPGNAARRTSPTAGFAAERGSKVEMAGLPERSTFNPITTSENIETGRETGRASSRETGRGRATSHFDPTVTTHTFRNVQESFFHIDDDAVRQAHMENSNYAEERNITWAQWYRYRINGLVLDYTPGFGRTEDSPGKIITYDPSRMQHMPGGICTPFNRRLSVWGSRSRHWQTILIAIITASTAYVWDYYLNNGNLDDELGNERENEHLLSVLTNSIEAISMVFLRLSSYTISAYVMLGVTRWYQRRLYYIALLGNMKAFVVLVMGLLENPEARKGVPEEELHPSCSPRQLKAAHDARCSFARYSVLVLELAMLKQRGHMDSEEGLQFLMKEKLVTSRAEWAMMVSGARHLTILNWMAHLLRRCKNVGILHDLEQLTSLIERARSNSSDMLDPTIYDFPYVSHSSALPCFRVFIFCC